MNNRFVAENWKVPPEGTTEAKISGWRSHDEQLYSFLKSTIPEALQHTGATAFDAHLRGVQAVLRNWGADESICNAGLFHSIYGTQGFQGFKLSFSKRPALRSLIGVKAERLVWIFCMADRLSVDQLVEREYTSTCSKTTDTEAVIPNNDFEISARLELGHFKISFTNEAEFLDFVELTLADWLEQCEGAALKKNELYGWDLGEAYSYRREAYRQMAELLVRRVPGRLTCAKLMHEAVYAQESEATRGLHQRVTPAMSPAAKEAVEAAASIDL